MDTYVLGFTVHDARGLVTSDGNPVDPYVVVECCGQSFSTEIKENKKEIVTFNQSMTWPEITLYPEQFESAFVEFKIMARNWFYGNDVIGSCQLQLSSIQKRKFHAYQNKWLTLKQDDNPDSTGLLKVSVFCLAPGNAAPGADEGKYKIFSISQKISVNYNMRRAARKFWRHVAYPIFEPDQPTNLLATPGKFKVRPDGHPFARWVELVKFKNSKIFVNQIFEFLCLLANF